MAFSFNGSGQNYSKAKCKNVLNYGDICRDTCQKCFRGSENLLKFNTLKIFCQFPPAPADYKQGCQAF